MSRLDRRTTRITDRIAAWREKWENRFEPEISGRITVEEWIENLKSSKEFWAGVIVGMTVLVLLAALIVV